MCFIICRNSSRHSDPPLSTSNSRNVALHCSSVSESSVTKKRYSGNEISPSPSVSNMSKKFELTPEACSSSSSFFSPPSEPLRMCVESAGWKTGTAARMRSSEVMNVPSALLTDEKYSNTFSGGECSLNRFSYTKNTLRLYSGDRSENPAPSASNTDAG